MLHTPEKEGKVEEPARLDQAESCACPLKQCTSGVEEAPHTPHPNALQESYSMQGRAGNSTSGGTHCLYGRSPVLSSHSRTPRA